MKGSRSTARRQERVRAVNRSQGSVSVQYFSQRFSDRTCSISAVAAIGGGMSPAKGVSACIVWPDRSHGEYNRHGELSRMRTTACVEI